MILSPASLINLTVIFTVNHYIYDIDAVLNFHGQYITVKLQQRLNLINPLIKKYYADQLQTSLDL